MNKRSAIQNGMLLLENEEWEDGRKNNLAGGSQTDFPY
jgi:hypothetical protein